MVTLFIVLLILLVVAALFTTMTPSLLLSAIGLAITSIVLTLLMFELNSPIAAVFELSVCAGLITVVFVSTISLTKRMTTAEKKLYVKTRLYKFLPLPIIVLALAILLLKNPQHIEQIWQAIPVDNNLKTELWNTRIFDIIGQLAIIFAGIFGVVILFKDLKDNKKEASK